MKLWTLTHAPHVAYMWIIWGIDSIVLFLHTLDNIRWNDPVEMKLGPLTPAPHVAVIQWMIWGIDSIVLFSHKLERGSSLTEINGEVFLSSVFTSPLTLPPSPQSPENFLLGEKTSLFHFQSPILSSFCPLLFLLGEKNKVNRCLARCSPCATTTNQPTNKAPNEPARPNPKWTKMQISDQIWLLLGKKS